MPVLPLKPFFAYKQNEFRIGGNPAEVFDFARRWRTFADNALTTAASLRTINDGGFLGSEEWSGLEKSPHRQIGRAHV